MHFGPPQDPLGPQGTKAIINLTFFTETPQEPPLSRLTILLQISQTLSTTTVQGFKKRGR